MNYPILLTILAAGSTVLGGLTVFLNKQPSKRVIAFSLGFAAGIMLMIALTEMLPATLNHAGATSVYGYLAFIFGILLFCGLHLILPHEHTSSLNSNDQERFKRTAVLLVIGISLHNFPEGAATFLTATHDMELGIGVALAISIHNFPEGLAVAAPIATETGFGRPAPLPRYAPAKPYAFPRPR